MTSQALEDLAPLPDQAIKAAHSEELYRSAYWMSCSLEHVCPPPGIQAYQVTFVTTVEATPASFDASSFILRLIAYLGSQDLELIGFAPSDVQVKCDGSSCNAAGAATDPLAPLSLSRRLLWRLLAAQSLTVAITIGVDQTNTRDCLVATLKAANTTCVRRS